MPGKEGNVCCFGIFGGDWKGFCHSHWVRGEIQNIVVFVIVGMKKPTRLQCKNTALSEFWPENGKTCRLRTYKYSLDNTTFATWFHSSLKPNVP